MATTRPLRAVPPDDNTILVPALARRYRGVIEVHGALTRPPQLVLINRLEVESYLRAMGEVLDPSWPRASLQAQAIAARTYALRTMAARGEICSGQRCQVYLGQQAEYRAMDEAVAQTAGQVLMYRHGLASAVYSANAAGISASREEGFGPLPEGSDAEYPYLRSAPYPTRDRFPWSSSIALADAAPRLGYRGELTSLRIARVGPSGRALEVALDGNAGTRVASGLELASALGLRSTLFSLRIERAAAAPPPPDAESLQAPPGEGPGTDRTESHRPPPEWTNLGLVTGRWAGLVGAGPPGHSSGEARFALWSCGVPGLVLLASWRKRRSRNRQDPKGSLRGSGDVRPSGAR